MRVFIAGGGPAGLYAGYRIKRRWPAAEVVLVEQNPADATFGFGVVFSDRALDFLRADDPETHALLMPAMETWRDLTIVHAAKTIRIDGIGFAAIGRLALLRLLQQRLAAVGVTARFGSAMNEPPRAEDYDLVICADGVNSLLRTTNADRFATQLQPLHNAFAWFGTTKPFATLTQTFVATPRGHFNAHHYRYAPDMSTFIVECDADTFARNGFAAMDEAESCRVCADIFADSLDGHALVANRSLWRHFPKLSNTHWSAGNKVLVGDALRTAHFSIGSGTRLALEDVNALVGALEHTKFDVPAALAAYEAARRPVVDKLVAAANASADWYEQFVIHMRLPPWAFAWSYIQRSGRIDVERLRQVSPHFVADYEQAMTRGG